MAYGSYPNSPNYGAPSMAYGNSMGGGYQPPIQPQPQPQPQANGAMPFQGMPANMMQFIQSMYGQSGVPGGAPGEPYGKGGPVDPGLYDSAWAGGNMSNPGGAPGGPYGRPEDAPVMPPGVTLPVEQPIRGPRGRRGVGGGRIGKKHGGIGSVLKKFGGGGKNRRKGRNKQLSQYKSDLLRKRMPWLDTHPDAAKAFGVRKSNIMAPSTYGSGRN